MLCSIALDPLLQKLRDQDFVEYKHACGKIGSHKKQRKWWQRTGYIFVIYLTEKRDADNASYDRTTINTSLVICSWTDRQILSIES